MTVGRGRTDLAAIAGATRSFVHEAGSLPLASLKLFHAFGRFLSREECTLLAWRGNGTGMTSPIQSGLERSHAVDGVNGCREQRASKQQKLPRPRGFWKRAREDSNL